MSIMEEMFGAELRVFVVEELSNSAEEHLRQKPSQSSELTKHCKNTVKCSSMFIQVQLKPTRFLLWFKGFYYIYIMVLSAEVVVFNCIVFQKWNYSEADEISLLWRNAHLS